MTRLLVILVGIALLPGCGKKTEPPPARGAEPKESCFETHDRASAGSRAVFERRHLQGGGPTWLAILDVLVKRRAEIVGPAPEPQPMVGATLVRHAGTQTWFATDDEAEGVVWCSGTAALRRDVLAEFDRVNADAALLELAIDQAGPNLE